MHIDEQSKIDLNGVPQFVSIRAEKENAPLLLYLHGGPGDAALPLVMKYNKMLEQQFYWFEKSCHFPQWSESERFNTLLCDLLS